MRIVKSEVSKIELDFFSQSDLMYYPYLKNKNEHYRLLVYLSSLYEGEILFDVGTAQGHSSLALSQNKSNRVFTYDIVPKYHSDWFKYENLKNVTKDINLEDEEIINSAKFISLDIDPHDGIQEIKFYELLKRINYKGIVLFDDINLNEGMRNFWDSVTHDKYDLTDIGHWSGSGLVSFSDEKIEIIE
jgi:predicted O-methyltransferase YrrM